MNNSDSRLYTIHFSVNGTPVEREVTPRTTLQELLHADLGRSEVKLGCAEGVCGACVVLIDGEPRASCLKLAVQADGRDIVTAAGLEALGGETALAHRALLAQVVARESFQCGYCAPGFMVSATHLVRSRRGSSAGEVKAALAGHLCRCTGYQQIIEAVTAAASGEPPPEAKEPRVDIRDKASGAVRYPTDEIFADQLIGKVLWSEQPFARVTAIDVAEASALPGVELVLTYRDIPGKNISGEGLFASDQPLLAEGQVRCRGDAIALVAARTDAVAREALRKIKVTYEPLPAVHDVRSAMEPGAPYLGGHRNIIAQFTEVHGDVDALFEGAEVIVEETYESGPNDHVCMEPEGGVGRWDGDTLELTITSLTPHAARAVIAKALDLPEDRIRIETPRMGGSFGKYLVPGVETLLALLASRATRPVRLVLDRREILERRAKRHPFWGRYRLALRRDGTFLALEADVIADAGPYVSLTPAVVAVFADEVTGAYEIPALRAVGRGVLTNNLPAAPMRGFGSQQIHFGIESIVEKAARAIGMDPAEIRAKNYVKTRSNGRGDRVVDPQIALRELTRRAASALGPRPQLDGDWVGGRGVAAVKCKYGYPYGMVDRFVVKVTLEADGRFFLESDVPDSGTGILAGAARIVARRLGLGSTPEARLARAILQDPSGHRLQHGRAAPFWRRWLYKATERLQGLQASKAMALVVRMEPPDEASILRIFARPINAMNRLLNSIKSRLFPYGIDSFVPRTSGSRGMLMVGGAAADAADRFHESAIGLAAPLLRVSSEELECSAEGVRRRAQPAECIPWTRIAEQAGGSLSALGQATLPFGLLFDPATGNQMGPIDSMFASHGVDLAVNRSTGEVKILRYAACQDVGKAQNPAAVRGQILGSIAMGIGQALLEKMVIERGEVKNATMLDYHVPTALDVPVDPVVIILESGGGRGPGGAKGVGEAGAVAAPIAIANALYDALGVQVTAIPVTPEDIVKAALARDRGAIVRPGA